MKDYGFLPDDSLVSDYKFGGITKLKGVPLTDGHWAKWLPEPENQLAMGEDTFACTNFGTLNCLEILIRMKYGDYQNYSDRFSAIVSGTKPGEGNSPNTVIESIRNVGLINELFLPFNPSMSLDTFYSPKPMTSNYLKLARQFLDKYKPGYESVNDNPESIKEALKCSPLGVSVEAWYEDQGKYVFPSNNRNHWVCLYDYVDGEYWLIFDSVENNIKKVAWNSKFGTIRRYSIEPNNDLSIIAKILDLIGRILNINALQIKEIKDKEIKQMPNNTPEPKPEKKSRIREWALAVQVAEGWREGTPSYRNNNPGNLKATSLTMSWGATGKSKASDGGYFCIYPDYETGLQALCNFLTLGAEDKLARYHEARTLRQFCKVYALPPNDGYALLIASKLGIDPDSDISTLL